jgi:hypothetical protein
MNLFIYSRMVGQCVMTNIIMLVLPLTWINTVICDSTTFVLTLFTSFEPRLNTFTPFFVKFVKSVIHESTTLPTLAYSFYAFITFVSALH